MRESVEQIIKKIFYFFLIMFEKSNVNIIFYESNKSSVSILLILLKIFLDK